MWITRKIPKSKKIVFFYIWKSLKSAYEKADLYVHFGKEYNVIEMIGVEAM